MNEYWDDPGVQMKTHILIVVSWFRDYSEFFSNNYEDDAHNYLVLTVNVEKSMCHLDEEVVVSTNDVVKYIDIGRKNFAQVKSLEISESPLYSASVPVSASIWSRIVAESDVSSVRSIDFNCPSIFTCIES